MLYISSRSSKNLLQRRINTFNHLFWQLKQSRALLATRSGHCVAAPLLSVAVDVSATTGGSQEPLLQQKLLNRLVTLQVHSRKASCCILLL